MNATACLLTPLLVFLLGLPLLRAQTGNELALDYKAIHAIASCQNVRCLTLNQGNAHGKIERVVLYTVYLMVDRSSRYASHKLLENMPSTEQEVAAIVDLPSWHEGATTSEAEMQRLGAVYANFPRVLALSVRRFPEYLPAYVRYGRIDNDVHSEYTVYAKQVCEAAPLKFMAAFRTLSDDDRQNLRTYVFDPNGCKPIFKGEAEEYPGTKY